MSSFCFAKRVFWAGLLLVHLAILPSAFFKFFGLAETGLSLAPILRIIALALSTLFFLLKIADVPWLRLRPGWRPLVASILVVAMLHVSALERTSENGDIHKITRLSVACLLATFVESEDARRTLFHWTASFQHGPTGSETAPLTPSFRRLLEANLPQPVGWPVLSHTMPRPPPVC